jgi:ubiquinone/menaquinone biosynthesis C-methylase UbiE
MANEGQLAHWNSDEAAHWVTHQNRYDAMLQPLGDRVIEGASIGRESRVLDIGCGCGATTLAAGALAKSATGIDLSEPMLSVARDLAATRGMSHVRFVQGDAQTCTFEADSHDAAISRFGVMF